MSTTTGRCESCGREDERVEPVQRVYVQPADWDREERVDVVAQPEQWCHVCREHYPHRPC